MMNPLDLCEPNIEDLEAQFLAQEIESPVIVIPKLSDPGTSNKGPGIFEDPRFLVDIDSVDIEAIREGSKSKVSNSTKFDEASIVHAENTSDDEDDKNYLDKKYSEYGKQIKDLLNKEEFNKKETELDNVFKKTESEFINDSKKSKTKNVVPLAVAKSSSQVMKLDIYTDPVFSIRIIKPLISNALLVEKMKGRLAINMSKVKSHTANADLDQDWVIAGVIVHKSPIKTSQKGAQFSIWSLSDLRDDIKTISLFLFKNAHKDLWKTCQGMVVSILNPSVLDKREESKDEAALSVDNPQKVMILGTSKDLGVCRSRKKNGEPCTAFVNMNKCEYCIYHVKQAYQQASKRSELQSACAGRGLSSLRNKVLGKSEVFYAGQSFTAQPAHKNRKHMAKDRNRLDLLSNYNRLSNSTVNNPNSDIANAVQASNKLSASRVEHCVKQREKDMERLRKLKNSVTESLHKETSTENKPETAVITETKSVPSGKNIGSVNTLNASAGAPKLSFGAGSNFSIDFSAPFRKLPTDRAKLNALKWVQKNGTIKKANPANLKGTEIGKKRALEQLAEKHDSKKIKLEEKKPTGVQSERFKKLLEATSANIHLLEQHEEEKREEYFKKLEKKEQMLEKMITTFKIACKAVRCIICNYTSFSASNKCKELRHPLRVYDSFKRFFKCLDCKHRTVTLDLLPKHSCKNCQSSRWEKTGMMDDKIIKNAGETLSIRGDEEQFVGAYSLSGNINLLVPDN